MMKPETILSLITDAQQDENQQISLEFHFDRREKGSVSVQVYPEILKSRK